LDKLYNEIFYETDCGMRFKLLPNGIQKPFYEKIKMYGKRITESVS